MNSKGGEMLLQFFRAGGENGFVCVAVENEYLRFGSIVTVDGGSVFALLIGGRVQLPFGILTQVRI